MKKAILGAVILGFLIMPLMGLAQQQEKKEVEKKEVEKKEVTRLERCKIRHDFSREIDGVTYKKGVTICVSTNIPDCAGGTKCEGTLEENTTCITKNTPLVCTLDLIYTIGDWIFVGILILAFLFVLLGAYGFMTAAGDPEKVGKAKNKILWAAIGVAVAFLARGIIKVVEMFVLV